MKKYYIISGISGFNDFFRSFFRGCEAVNGRSNIDIIPLWLGISNEFWSFFDPTDKISICPPEESKNILENIEKLRPHPLDFKNVGTHIVPIPYAKNINWSDDSWDFVYQGLPDGFLGIQYDYSSLFFKYLILKESFKNTLKAKLDILTYNYAAVHFRVSDIFRNRSDLDHSNYIDSCKKSMAKIIEENSNKKILLCTDSAELIKTFVDDKKVHSFTYIKLLLDKGIDNINRSDGIHCTRDRLGFSDYEYCENSLTDFFLMVLADLLVPSKIGSFSRAADVLRSYLISLDTNYRNYILG